MDQVSVVLSWRLVSAFSSIDLELTVQLYTLHRVLPPQVTQITAMRWVLFASTLIASLLQLGSLFNLRILRLLPFVGNFVLHVCIVPIYTFLDGFSQRSVMEDIDLARGPEMAMELKRTKRKGRPVKELKH